MVLGQGAQRLLLIYGYKIACSIASQRSRLTLHRNLPNAVRGRSALLLFCLSPVFQFSSGICKRLCTIEEARARSL